MTIGNHRLTSETSLEVKKVGLADKATSTYSLTEPRLENIIATPFRLEVLCDLSFHVEKTQKTLRSHQESVHLERLAC